MKVEDAMETGNRRKPVVILALGPCAWLEVSI